MRIGDGLTAWIKFKAAERWQTEEEVISDIRQYSPITPPMWLVRRPSGPMNRIINRPDLSVIARDLALGLMIAGAVVLFL